MIAYIHSLSEKYQRWIASSPNRQVLSVTFQIAVLTAFTKVFYLFKDLLVADHFGRSDDLDAFLIAYVIPTFVLNILTAQLGAALIPIYVNINRERGRESAIDFLGSMATIYVLFLCAVAVIIVWLGPFTLPALASGFGADKIRLTQYLLSILAFNVVFNGIAALWRGVLNAEEVFNVPALSAVGTPLGMIFFLVAFRSWGAYTLAAGMAVGAGLETLVLGINMVKKGLPVLPRRIITSTGMGIFLRQYGMLVGGALLMACTDLVDQSMAASLPAGSVSALSYGSKLPMVPISLIIMALGTAVLPYASKMVSAKDWAGLKLMLKKDLWLIFLITGPLTLLFAFFSESIIRLVFERGAFTAEDTGVVAFVQSLYVLQIPVFTAYILVSRIISAMQANRILMIVAGITLAAKIGMNLGLMGAYGVAGIALSTTIMYGMAFILNLFFLARRIARNQSASQADIDCERRIA